MVVNLQRAVECHLGDKYWKCNKRNNILHIKTSLGTPVALDRKEYYDSLVWVIVLLRNMTGKHSQSRESNPRHSEIHVAIFVVDVSMSGSSISMGVGRVLIHEGSPIQGSVLLPKMLIKPPLRNTLLSVCMQIWEQS